MRLSAAKTGVWIWLGGLLLQLLGGQAAQAHWMNLTGAESARNLAEIYIDNEQIRLVLEILPADLDHFRPGPVKAPPSASGSGSLKTGGKQSRLNFSISTPDGRELPFRLKRLQPRTRKDRRIAYRGMDATSTKRYSLQPLEDQRVLYAELACPLLGKPEALRIAPPLDQAGRAAVELGIVVYHQGIPVIDYCLLPAPARLSLDWSDPWLSAFDQAGLKRHHGPEPMSFVYIEPFEVRHEIIMRLNDLASFMDLDLKGQNAALQPDALAALKERLGAFLLERNPLLVDGKPVKPVLEGLEFLEITLAGVQTKQPAAPLKTSTALLGAIITRLIPAPPKKLELTWDLFREPIDKVRLSLKDPGGSADHVLTPGSNRVIWQNELAGFSMPNLEAVALDQPGPQSGRRNKHLAWLALLGAAGFLLWRGKYQKALLVKQLGLVMLLLAFAMGLWFYLGPALGGAENAPERLSAEHARKVFSRLMKNMYRAFDFKDESLVYDKLAISVSGGLLDLVYLESRKSLAIQRAGGAQAKVQQFDLMDLQLLEPGNDRRTVPLKARWSITGRVSHWGHIHRRSNLYEARVSLSPEDGVWKISGLEILDERRIPPAGAAGL